MRRVLTVAVLVAATAGGAGTASASQCDPKALGGCLAKCLDPSVDLRDPAGSVRALCD